LDVRTIHFEDFAGNGQIFSKFFSQKEEKKFALFLYKLHKGLYLCSTKNEGSRNNLVLFG